MKLTIELLKKLCENKDNIVMTFHVSEQCRIRNITAYYPDNTKWKSDYKTRKAAE